MIFIPFNVPSLKNSKQIVSMGPRCPKCKKGKWSSLTSSKAVKKWKRETKPYWIQHKKQFQKLLEGKEKPYRIKFTFVRKSRHKFDYTNAMDTIQDEMVHHGWLPDDNADIIIPIPGRYRYNKEEPGVWIQVL